MFESRKHLQSLLVRQYILSVGVEFPLPLVSRFCSVLQKMLRAPGKLFSEVEGDTLYGIR